MPKNIFFRLKNLVISKKMRYFALVKKTIHKITI